MTVIFDRHALHQGDWLHVRGTSFVARFIRRGLNRMVHRLCVHHKIEPRHIWGNHDGVFVKRTGRWYIGEALGSGNQLTPLTVYEKSINADKEEVKVYRVIPADDQDSAEHIGIHGAYNWIAHIRGTRYDYYGLFYLWVKSILPFKKVREWEWANWCTEGGAKAFRRWTPPAFDILQTKYPTPMTVEQCAGELPHKDGKRITLREITAQVLKTSSE